MTEDFKLKLEALNKALVHAPGNSAMTFRQAVRDYAKKAAEGNLVLLKPMPDSLRQLVDKVVFATYSIEDEDFLHAQSEMQSDDAVIEMLYCSALGAGLYRWEMFKSINAKTLKNET